jgi:Sigma-54 interaction domain
VPYLPCPCARRPVRDSVRLPGMSRYMEWPSKMSVQLDQDLQLLRTTQSNVVIIGTDEDVESALLALHSTFRQPVVTRPVTNPLELPSPNTGGALILRGVANLTSESQASLQAWLDQAAGRVQVIATNEQPLWPLVEAGKFLAALYYRLNLVYIDLTWRDREVTDAPHGASLGRIRRAGSIGD